jgi:hypothetical protein
MVVLFYIGAAALLLAALVADSPFTSTNLIVLAAVSFLLARFIRIERRLDKIEGVQRESKIKGALTWVRANRSGFITVGQIAIFVACLWFSWGFITQSAQDDWAAISPKSPHPWLHAVLGASPVITAVLVWFPIGAFLVFLVLSLVAFYVIGVAVLVGIWPQKWLKTASSVPRNSRYEQIFGSGITVTAIWMLLAMTYAKKETDSFLALFPDPSRQMGDWIFLVVIGGWMPLVFIAMAVQRRRERRSRDHADSSV